MDGPEKKPVLDYGLRFQPVWYIKETFVPATNRHLQKIGIQQPITFEEYLLVQALLYGMEVYKLPRKRLYWSTEQEGIFPSMDYGKYIAPI